MTRWVRALALVAWPLVLAARFAIYGATDNPTHLGPWRTADRWPMALGYSIVAALIVATIGPTPRRLLALKAAVVSLLALSSLSADLIYNGTIERRAGSATGWLCIAVANVGMILLRLSWATRERA
jgi:hypothetical protein